MITYYYILAQNYAKDCLKKLHNDRRGMDTIQIVLIIGIAVIILGAVVVGGKTLWETVNQKSTDLIGGG